MGEAEKLEGSLQAQAVASYRLLASCPLNLSVLATVADLRLVTGIAAAAAIASAAADAVFLRGRPNRSSPCVQFSTRLARPDTSTKCGALSATHR